MTKIRSHGWAINICQPGDSSRDLFIHKIRRAGGGELCPGHFSWICEMFGVWNSIKGDSSHGALKIGDESHGRILKKPPTKQRSNFLIPFFFQFFVVTFRRGPRNGQNHPCISHSSAFGGNKGNSSQPKPNLRLI